MNMHVVLKHEKSWQRLSDFNFETIHFLYLIFLREHRHPESFLDVSCYWRHASSLDDLCRPSPLLFVVLLKWYWCWKNIKVHFIFYCFTELFSMCYSLLINKEFYVNVNQTFHFFDQRLIFAFPCCFDAIFKCRLIGTSQVISLLNNVFLV